MLDSPKGARRLTVFGTSHEVVAGLFGVLAVHVASLGVEHGEHVAVEAVVVPHEAGGRRAVWHGRKLLLLHSLGFYVEVEDLMPCGDEKNTSEVMREGPRNCYFTNKTVRSLFSWRHQPSKNLFDKPKMSKLDAAPIQIK